MNRDLEEHKKKIVVICGATATGKSGLAISAAKKIDAEIISADSMQIYKGLDIATAKVTEKEADGVVHHMLDIIEPWENFSVADYVKRARPIIDDIISRGKKVIICGGTGLYIDALCDGREFLKSKERPDIIEQLNTIDTETLHKRLQTLDSISAEKIHPNNRKRIIRALYVTELTGKPFSIVGEEAMPKSPPYNRLLLYCHYPQRIALYDAINARVNKMKDYGLVDEARYVYDNRSKFITAAAAIGYKELFEFFEEENNLDECIERLKQATRNYAKRQMSWFNRYSDANFIEAYENSAVNKAFALLEEFYN